VKKSKKVACLPEKQQSTTTTVPLIRCCYFFWHVPFGLCTLHIKADPNNLSALTAGHYLTGRSLRSMPERIVNDSKANALQRFEAVTALKQSFWHRWSTDYFNALQSRTKWTSPSPNVAVGTMVLIHEDNVPGQQSPSRSAAKGTCCRPVHKLAVLPMS